MTLNNVHRFNLLINHLFSKNCIGIDEINDIFLLYGYSNKEKHQIMQHLLRSNVFMQQSEKLFVKSHYNRKTKKYVS